MINVLVVGTNDTFQRWARWADGWDKVDLGRRSVQMGDIVFRGASEPEHVEGISWDRVMYLHDAGETNLVERGTLHWVVEHIKAKQKEH